MAAISRNRPSEDDDDLVTSFEQLKLGDELLPGILNLVKRPSVLQKKALPPILNRQDVIAQGPHGTGKSLMVAISACQLIEVESSALQAIVLSPSRQSAVRIGKDIEVVGRLRKVHVYAGNLSDGIEHDIKELEGVVHIFSTTPGRLNAIFKTRTMQLRHMKVLICDDFDELMSRGFFRGIHAVYRVFPSNAQVVLTCATLSDEVLKMARKFMADPVKVLLDRDQSILQGVRHLSVAVKTEKRKFRALCDLYERITITQAIIFCRTKRKVMWLSKKLCMDNFKVLSMHDGMRLKERDAVMDKFNSVVARALVTTDVWTGGIVPRVSHIINFDIPADHELYHRRVSLLGSGCPEIKGMMAITFVRKVDYTTLKKIKRHWCIEIEKVEIEKMDDRT